MLFLHVGKGRSELGVIGHHVPRHKRPYFFSSNFSTSQNSELMLQMDSPAQIEGGLSKRNWLIRFKNNRYRQKMFSTPPKLIKSVSRSSFDIIRTQFDVKKRAHSKATLRVVWKPLKWIKQNKMKLILSCVVEQVRRVFETLYNPIFHSSLHSQIDLLGTTLCGGRQGTITTKPWITHYE